MAPSRLSWAASRTWSIWASRSNELSGPIPAELGGLTSLTTLYLAGNELSGPIPPELGNLTNLEYLYLASTDLSGPLPAELSGLTSLRTLDLRYNELSGPIPVELGKLGGTMLLNGNQFSGCIPNRWRGRHSSDVEELGLPYCD